MNTNITDEMVSIASLMEGLHAFPDATIEYHLLADAIYWSDELPLDLPRMAENIMRLVIRYRTSLILGTPEQKWEKYWNEAKQHFPNWIGFATERTCPNANLMKLIEHLRKQNRQGGRA